MANQAAVNASKDLRGQGDKLIKTDLTAGDEAKYKEFIARSGTLNDWVCRICNATTLPREHWAAHCNGRKHAKACTTKMSSMSKDEYLKKYGDLPGPTPSKSVNACNLKKWETGYVFDELMKQRRNKMEPTPRQSASGRPSATTPSGLLGSFPGDTPNQRFQRETGNSYGHSPYDQNPTGAYGGKGLPHGDQGYNQRGRPFSAEKVDPTGGSFSQGQVLDRRLSSEGRRDPYSPYGSRREDYGSGSNPHDHSSRNLAGFGTDINPRGGGQSYNQGQELNSQRESRGFEMNRSRYDSRNQESLNRSGGSSISHYDPFDKGPGRLSDTKTDNDDVVPTTKALQMLHQLQEKQRQEQEKLEQKLMEQKNLLDRQKREMERERRKHEEEIELQNKRLREEKRKLEEEKRAEERKRREKERELERERQLRLEEIRRQQEMKNELERKRIQREKEEAERQRILMIKQEQEKREREEKARQEVLAKQLRMKLELEQKLKEEMEAKRREQERKEQEERQKQEDMRKIREKEEEIERLLKAKKAELQGNDNNTNNIVLNSPWQQQGGTTQTQSASTQKNSGRHRNLVSIPIAKSTPAQGTSSAAPQGELVDSAPWHTAASGKESTPKAEAPWTKAGPSNRNQTSAENKSDTSNKPPWKGSRDGDKSKDENPPWTSGKDPQSSGTKNEKPEEAPWKGREGRRKETSGGKGDDKGQDKDHAPWLKRGDGSDRRSSHEDTRSRSPRGRSKEEERRPWKDGDDRSRGRDSADRKRRSQTDSDFTGSAPWNRRESGEKKSSSAYEDTAPWEANRSRKNPRIEQGHCYKIILDDRELRNWQNAQADFMACMDNLPTEPIMSSLSQEERNVVAQIQRMTGLEPASVVTCTLQLLQSMAPKVFNILGSMDPNFMQSLISDAMSTPGRRGSEPESADFAPPWARDNKRSREQPYKDKRPRWM